LRVLRILAAIQPKRLSMNHLHSKLSRFQSRSIKLNQGVFLCQPCFKNQSAANSLRFCWSLFVRLRPRSFRRFLKIDVLPWLRYQSSLQIMSCCCSRSFLALLLGAGVSGGLPGSALAGDKIEFSRASETLATPAVDRPKSDPADAFSDFSLKNAVPQPQLYPMVSLPAAAPSRRNHDGNLRNGEGGLGSDLERFRQNNGFENPIWEMDATNYSSNPATNYFNTLRASGTWDDPAGLGRGLDKLDSRYGQGDGRLDSLTPSERRDRQNDAGVGNAGNSSRTTRAEDAYGPGGGTSLAGLLQKQNKSRLEARPGLFKSISPFSGSKYSGDLMSPSLMPSDSPFISPLDAAETGYNVYKEPSGHLPSLTPGRITDRQDEGISRGLPGPSAWGDMPGLNYQAPQSTLRKPVTPASPAGVPRQQGGATLPFPKQPGSVFK